MLARSIVARSALVLSTLAPSTLALSTLALSVLAVSAWVPPALAQQRVGAISTTFRFLGPNDKIVIERFDDPRVANVSCYLSRAETGGIKGGLGFAEDPSRFSVACRAVGPLSVPADLPRQEVMGSAQASLFFKAFQIHRLLDPEKHVLIYTVISTKLINGSPFNSISVVPLDR
ncbi:MAG TPA: CreA family protein [Rhodopila sp.]|jgi:CreA protein|nr:CreA family protein [Rhodopila sp.]